ncbi:hypothetical protein QTG56_16115 [Rossellomorea sp. AcN35-11]|nr:hypothetical protein [Rossellomorea aquimaris]WJV28582.1 hypothetical protein QTG56_16115 [Rossellomorea sp. AcN35-11]
MITKKKVLLIGIIMFIILLTIMIITTPSKKDFEQWILEDNEIVCKKDGWDVKCIKDDREIKFRSSHYKNVALFSSLEANYEYGNGEHITYRTLGIFGKVFTHKDGVFWKKVLN